MSAQKILPPRTRSIRVRFTTGMPIIEIWRTDPALGVRKLLVYETNLGTVPRRFFSTVQNMVGLEFWLIPATILLKLESADLTFTSLVKGKVYGSGKKLYHHEEPVEEPEVSEQRPRWRYCPFHGTNHLSNDDDDDDDGDKEDDLHRVERELELFEL